MKKGIHPEVFEVIAQCVCGNKIPTLSTQKEVNVDLCSNCHPFFTGAQKFVDTAGRIEKFNRRFGKMASASSSATK